MQIKRQNRRLWNYATFSFNYKDTFTGTRPDTTQNKRNKGAG